MKKVVLVGNPNVGKSLIFSRITGIGTVAANYAGTTVEAKIGKFQYGSEEYELIDGPGVYSLEEFSGTDEAALELIREGDLIVNVVDATNLERNLHLTLQLIEKRKPMIVCLNLWEDTLHQGIEIDTAELARRLDLPVVTTSARSGEGIAGLVEALGGARISSAVLDLSDSWSSIGNIVDQVQKRIHRHHKPLEKLSDFTLHPLGGLVTAIVVLAATLFTVRFLGEGLINEVLDPLFTQYYHPTLIQLMNDYIHSDMIRGFLIGYTADPLESFGVLTSGVYIALVLVFPYFFSFYLIFGFLEDLGYLPRLAIILDNLFHRLGMHGYSSIPVMLGLGCKVPAFMATRVLTNQREKILTIALIFLSVPCLPQSSMIVSLGMHYGVFTVVAIFAVLTIVALSINALLSKIFKGETAEFFTEIPAYRIPSLKDFTRKIWLRMKDYFKEVLPMIAIGVLIMNALDKWGVIAFITKIIREPVQMLFGLPPDIAPIMILGFLRKDVSIALLAPLQLSAQQFIIGSIFLAIYTPCIASFFTLVKEVGMAASLKILALVFSAAIVTAALVHGVFNLISLMA